MRIFLIGMAIILSVSTSSFAEGLLDQNAILEKMDSLKISDFNLNEVLKEEEKEQLKRNLCQAIGIKEAELSRKDFLDFWENVVVFHLGFSKQKYKKNTVARKKYIKNMLRFGTYGMPILDYAKPGDKRLSFEKKLDISKYITLEGKEEDLDYRAFIAVYWTDDYPKEITKNIKLQLCRAEDFIKKQSGQEYDKEGIIDVEIGNQDSLSLHKSWKYFKTMREVLAIYVDQDNDIVAPYEPIKRAARMLYHKVHKKEYPQ